MTREELKAHCEKQIEMCEFWAIGKGEKPHGKVYEEHKLILELLEQEPVLDKINKMKSKIAFLLEFWDYSPNNNPLAKDMLETLTNFWGDIKAESEE